MHNNMTRLFKLDGRVALVSGGSSGIGKAIGLALARAGASVVLVARREQELAAAAGEFAAAGLRASALPCDLADREALRGFAARAGEAYGAPDILVNASGINVRKPFEDTADEDWDRSLAINLTAPFLLTRALAPAMRERGWGRIINITSLQCVRAFPDSAPYGASKGGLMQLTRAIAEYWSRHGVTCNAIAPGFFETSLTAPVMSDPARVQALAASTMIGRNGRLDDLHGAAVFLASEASAYITGQTLFIDGGFSAR